MMFRKEKSHLIAITKIYKFDIAHIVTVGFV